MFGLRRKPAQAVRSYRNARDVVFLELRDAVFCTNCELISYNNASRCLSCGSLALLSLARVLGGSLLEEEAPKAVEAPAGEILGPEDPFDTGFLLPHLVASRSTTAISVDRALAAGVQRAQELTHASGVALAMRDEGRMVCRARAGSAPELGVEVSDEGVTAVAVRTGQMWWCDDTERDPWVNRIACRQSGIRSVVVAPVVSLRETVGALAVMSDRPAAFDRGHAASVECVAAMVGFIAAVKNEDNV
jgi:putative methionine-R-sulfoxide reductase with GAF domain